MAEQPRKKKKKRKARPTDPDGDAEYIPLDEVDDTTTFNAEEALTSKAELDEEVNALKAESEMTLDELMAHLAAQEAAYRAEHGDSNDEEENMEEEEEEKGAVTSTTTDSAAVDDKKLAAGSSPSLLERSWFDVTSSSSSPSPAGNAKRQKVGGTRVRVVEFNMLADGLAQNGNFCKLVSTPQLLEWKYRMPLIVQEIARSAADIVCLAECNHWDELLPALKKHGFDGVFSASTNSPATLFNAPADGVAILYRASKFTLRQSTPHGAEPKQLLASLQTKDQAQPVTLTVSMVHQKAKKGFAALRKSQAETAVARVKEHQKALGLDSTTTPTLLCGDYNAEIAEPCFQEVLLKDATFALASAYAAAGAGTVNAVHGLEEHPAWTTWKIRAPSDMDNGGLQKHTIDFILHTPQLRPVKLWGLPSSDALEAGLPEVRYPSDHVAIGCEFAL